MALRANLHLIAARELKADLLLSPMRSQLQWGGYNLFFLKNKEIDHSNDKTGSRMALARSGISSAVQLQGLPMFAYWIARHMPERPGLIRAALELREEKEFKTIRGLLVGTQRKSRRGDQSRC